jgi:hypothetical protein
MGNNIFDIASIGQGAAAQAAGGIIGMGISAYNDNRTDVMNRKLMQQQMGAQREMTDYNTQKQLELWKATSYQAQMEQLKKAGLNPGLIYGMGGGGGQTAQIAQGHVEGATANQNPGEMQASMGMGIQGAMMSAQIEMMKAEARDKNADAQNKETVIPENIGANTGLQKAQTIVEQAKGKIQNATIEEQIRTITQTAALLDEQVMQAGAQTTVDRATVYTKIDQQKADLLSTVLEQALTKAQTGKTKEETALITKEVKSYTQELLSRLADGAANRYAAINNADTADAQRQIARDRLTMDQWINDMPESMKTIAEVVERAAQAIFLKNILGGKTPTPIKGFHNR